jgi:hypothetical protein
VDRPKSSKQPKGKRSPAATGRRRAGAVSSTGPTPRTSQFGPLLAFLVLLVLYVATLTPSVAGGDSGELTAAALTGGIPHPSGYPLFALLARVFAALPLGHTPIWRVNLLSAVSMAAAGGLLCAVVLSWKSNVAAGLMAAALFGTSPVVWSNATSAEVFGLNALLVALAFYLWSRVEQKPSRNGVFLLLFACGLAMCNHHTFVFVGAPLALRSLWVARHNLGAKGFGLALVFGLLGLVPYLYLMSASASAAAVSWADKTNTFHGLFAHILRRTYGTFSMGRPTADAVFVTEGTFFPTLEYMWGGAFRRLLWVGPLLALVGMYYGAKSRQLHNAARVVRFVFCFYGLSYCGLSNLSIARPLYLSVLGRFCIESDLLLALAAGFGAAILLHKLKPQSVWLRWAPVSAALVFAIGVSAHAKESDGRNNTVFRDFVTTAFASLPPRAIVITSGDEITNSVFYFHDVEKLRPDVIHLGVTYLSSPWYTAQQRRLHRDLNLPEGSYGEHGWNVRQLLDGNPNRPVIVIGHLEDWDRSWEQGYKLVFTGLVSSLVRDSEFPTYRDWVERDKKAIGTYNIVPALRASVESWENALGQRVLGTQVGRAHLSLIYGSEQEDPTEPAQYALGLLERVVAMTGGNEKLKIAGLPGLRKLDVGPAAWKDLGIAYEILSRLDLKYFPNVAIAYERFIDVAADNDPDLKTAREYLKQMRGTKSSGRR